MFHIISSKYDHNIVPKEKPSLTQKKIKEKVKEKKVDKEFMLACLLRFIYFLFCFP